MIEALPESEIVMSQVEGLQKFTSALFSNCMKHLPNGVKRASAAMNEAAVQFTETGDTRHRDAYFTIKSHVENIKKMAAVMKENPIIDDVTKATIIEGFPELSDSAAISDPATTETPFANGEPVSATTAE